MKLYFRDSHCKDRLLAECNTIQEVTKEISSFIKAHNFKSYYTRIWYETKGTKTPYFIRDESRFIYDVGSYSEFFELRISRQELEKLPEDMRKLYREDEE